MSYQPSPSPLPPSTPLDPPSFPQRSSSNSPAPPVPGLNITPQQAAALQPGSIVDPGGARSGVVTPLGAGSTGSGRSPSPNPPPSPGAQAADKLSQLSLGSSSTPQQSQKPADYIYFPRQPSQYPTHLLQKSTATKMRLELYYKQAVEGVVQRKERRVALEKELVKGQEEDWQKARQLQGLGRRESK